MLKNKQHTKQKQKTKTKTSQNKNKKHTVINTKRAFTTAAAAQQTDAQRTCVPPCPEFYSRMKYSPYLDKVMSADDAVTRHLLTSTPESPMSLGFSGFTGVSAPKAIPAEIVKKVDQHNLSGQLQYNVFVGASTGPDIDDAFASRGLIARRYPFQAGKKINEAINTGKIPFADQNLSTYTDRFMLGNLNHRWRHPNLSTDKQLDVAIIEASEITEDGYIVPGLGCGLVELAQSADKIIIELNTHGPSLRGFHDIVQYDKVEQRNPYNIKAAADRCGDEFVKIDPSRVVAVIPTSIPEYATENPHADEESQRIAGHIMDFFEHEVKVGRMPKNLYHLQSGVGNISNAVIESLQNVDFHDMKIWTEVLQDSFLPLLESGKIAHATTAGIKFSREDIATFYDHLDKYRDVVLLRNQTITNSPEIISRIGIIAMNTPVDFDIYGNVNSSHVGSGRVISGVGGSNDFMRHGLYSIFHAPATRPTKTDPFGISTIVPQVVHVDSDENCAQIFVTGEGLADLRGLSPKERAKEVIEKCAHPVYKDQLNDYFNRAVAYKHPIKIFTLPAHVKRCVQHAIELATQWHNA